MTRETKAGLVVSCSFLCLVGVVLYCKVTGKNPGMAEAYSEGASAEAPADPTPIEETIPTDKGPVISASVSDNSGPGLDSEKLAAASPEGKAKSPASGNDGYSIPGSTSNVGNEGPRISALSSTNDSTWESEDKTASHSQGTKTASAQAGPNYAIPDAPSNEKDSRSSSTSSENKDRSTKESKAGATLDPLADLKEAYKESKTNPALKNSNDASKAAAGASDESGKDNGKNSEVVRNDDNKIVNSSTGGANTTTDDKNLADRKTAHDQEPPPIPAGLHDPYHSLPEAPVVPVNSSDTTNRSPRDAGLRKPTNPPAESAAANASRSGSNRVITGITTSPATGAVSSPQGTLPMTTPNLTPAELSPFPSPSGIRDRDGKVAANAGQGSGLTPGVMPSPRLTLVPPSGDTAPEANVRLGPPTAGVPSNQSAEGASHDPASALPPSNQFAQGPAPNLGGQSQGAANPYQTQGPATGLIQPAGFPAAKVDSYDEETYLCKQGDKFEDISTKFYQTDKYAQALLLFNRNHPRAAAAVRQDPPALAAGQPVYIPPLRVLEKQFATAIPDHAPLNPAGILNSPNPDSRNPATASTGAGATPGGSAGNQSSSLPDNRITPLPAGIGPNSDNQNGGQYSLPSDNRNRPQPTETGATSDAPAGNPYATRQDPRNSVPVSPMPGTLSPSRPGAQGQERTYQVPKNGETFWEISRKTLGNPNRWSEISRLNPQIKPQFPVPGGTNLRMPLDARVDPPNPVPAEKTN